MNKINNNFIIAKELVAGQTYQFREDDLVADVSLKYFEFRGEPGKNEYIHLELTIIDSNDKESPPGQTFKVSCLNEPFGFSGMWRLYGGTEYFYNSAHSKDNIA